VEKTALRGALCSVLLTKYYLGDRVKKREMERACSIYGGEVRAGF
jgi:hypothetical protein